MKLLLDTHILMWSQSEPKRLSVRVARALDHARNEWWISPVSALEILMLYRKGRVRQPRLPSAWITNAFSRSSAYEAPFTHAVAMALDTFALPHSDPIDTILVATARAYHLTLVTADRVLIEAKACRVLSNL